MATTLDVLQMLLPKGGWSNSGEGYAGINFGTAKSFSEAEFEAGFAQFDAWQAGQEADKATAKAAALAKLAALGLSVDDLKALGLGGN